MKENLKNNHLSQTVEHFEITQFNAIPLIEQYNKMAFQSRNLARAAVIYEKMLTDDKCAAILTLAGSVFSAGLKKVVLDMIKYNMIDAIVSTGAVIVDQDFFEALGFRHYQGDVFANDNELMKMGIDRIYDTYINEDELRVCDQTIGEIADSVEPGIYSSREFIRCMGEYLIDKNLGKDSVVRTAYEKNVPIFVPAFSDCSAGFGLVYHQWHRKDAPSVSIDSVKDFLELTKIKIGTKDTGLLMIGGGVPKNFIQDIVVSADFLGYKANLHKYAIQITVADERDGGLSGSTLKEAHSWGKVDEGFEQMVYSEATVALPILASYAYHKQAWKNRKQRNLNNLFEEKKAVAV